jgi:hypothetical protein
MRPLVRRRYLCYNDSGRTPILTDDPSRVQPGFVLHPARRRRWRQGMHSGATCRCNDKAALTARRQEGGLVAFVGGALCAGIAVPGAQLHG